jgi:predicted phosphodiesterase
MRIQIVSDLHLEFSDVEIENQHNADVLILSGDIMLASDLHNSPAPGPYSGPGDMTRFNNKNDRAYRYRAFLKRCSERFTNVIYVAGNHEFYDGKWIQTLTTLSDECKVFGNVYFLERGAKTIDGVTFIGATLWTDLNKGDPLTLHAVRDMMMDYKTVRKELDGYASLRPHDTVIRHRDTLDYFKSVMSEKGDEKFVVCTHHSPSFQSVHEEYRSEYLMNGAYHSSLEEFILDRPQIKLWTHGHTHHPFDYKIGDTRVVCNPRGYENDSYSEDTGWDSGLTVEI